MLQQSLNKITLVLILSFLCSTLSFRAQSVGGTTSGAASYCPGDNSGFISLVGHNGSILYWQSSTDGTNWTNITNILSTQSYLNLTITTHYRAVVQDGAFPADTSTISTITIYDAADGGTISGAGTFCVEATNGSLTANGTTGNVLYWLESSDNGVTWSQISNTTTTYNYSLINTNMVYALVTENEPSCPTDTSDYAYFSFDSLAVAGTLSASDTTGCSYGNTGTLNLSGTKGNIVDWYSTNDTGGGTWTAMGNTTSSATYNDLLETMSYQVVVESGVCPNDTSNVVDIYIYNVETVDAGPDQIIDNHASTVLEATGNGSVVWSPIDGIADPNSHVTDVTPTASTTYIITQTDANGCVDVDSVFIKVNFPIPSGITPNEDGLNDYFLIDNVENLTENSLVIYNRQGNIVYSKSPYDNKWNGTSNNGKNLPDGIYYYIFDAGTGDEVLTGYVLIKR